MKLTDRELFLLAVITSYAHENTDDINEAFDHPEQSPDVKPGGGSLEVWCENARTHVRGPPVTREEIREFRDAVVAWHRQADAPAGPFQPAIDSLAASLRNLQAQLRRGEP